MNALTLFFQALGTNPFLQTALIAGFLASISSGIIGSYVVVKRIAFISGSIAHSVLSGMGFCLWIKRFYGVTWLEPMHGALVAAILSAVIIGWIHLHYREREDAVIAAIWAIGMALGVLFIALTPGFNVELQSFLLGNILWVSWGDLVTLGCLAALILVLAWTLHSRFLAICFDEEQAHLQGISVNKLYLLLLSLVAISVVLLIQIVGIILVMTMLTIPAMISGLFTRRLSMMMLFSVLLGIVFCSFGTVISYDLDWPLGATIALLAGAVYIVSLVFSRRQH